LVDINPVIKISKYDKACTRSRKTEIEQLICLDCKTMQVIENPKDGEKYGRSVAPRLVILKIVRWEEDPNLIAIYWSCPTCATTKVIETYESWKEIADHLTFLANNKMLAKRNITILQRIQNGQFQLVPGYTNSLAKIANNR